jgi:3-dehydroquinate synthetase
MSHDKKAEKGTIKYILLEKIGKAKIESVSDELVEQALKVAEPHNAKLGSLLRTSIQ